MAEAVATLALASSILQVIDFGTKIASTASKVYQASQRNDDSLNELEDVYKNLSSTLDSLQKDSTASVDSEANGIKSLAKGCSELAKEVVDTLRSLGVGKAKTRRKALWVALKHTWKDKDILALQARLNEFKSQLTLCLLVSVRQFAGQSLSKQEEILERLGQVGDGPIGASILDYVTSGLDASSQEQHRQFLERDLIETIRHQKSSSGDDTHALKIETTQEVHKKSINLLLKSLEYPGMQDREDRIADAHEVTFQWIFERSSDKWVGFREWLESDDKLYWITGKAGSGKSTLMKYISHPYPLTGQQLPRCRSHEYLERWAASRNLIVASFYFWNSGREIQTTHRGLLFTLLRQILEQCPNLLPLASPSRWENLSLFGLNPEWTDTELRSLLLQCIENLGRLNATVALFVDGLDEFGGDLNVLISMFEEIQKLPRQKLCVASRTWNEFRDAFAQNPSLMVEHLTHDDITNFVIARFDSDPRFAELKLRESDFADRLVEEIVSKSSGVFLWVSLVVSSLLSGMGNGDRIADFQRRLDQLPPDLYDLYRKMIRSLDPFYLEHTAQLFALVGASKKPMNLLLASYVDEENPKVALEMAQTPVTDQDAQVRMEAMRRRINSRSKGLLEIKGGPSTPQGFVYDAATHKGVTVQYLHRTVKDFVEKDEEVQRIFAGALKSSFDPHLMLLAGNLAYKKKVPENAKHLSKSAIYGELFSHARLVQKENVGTMVNLLDDYEKISPSIIDVPVQIERFIGTFLSLATAFNVVEYVRARAPKHCLVPTTDQSQRPLLMEALLFTYSGSILLPIRFSDASPSARNSYKETIEVLLGKGADPLYAVHRDPAVDVGVGYLVSPLAVAAAGYLSTQHELYLLALKLLAEDAKFDSSTLEYTTNEYLRMNHPGAYERKPDLSIWSWYLVKKSLRKALYDATQGKTPDFEELDNKIEFGVVSRMTMFRHVRHQIKYWRHSWNTRSDSKAASATTNFEEAYHSPSITYSDNTQRSSRDHDDDLDAGPR